MRTVESFNSLASFAYGNILNESESEEEEEGKNKRRCIIYKVY